MYTPCVIFLGVVSVLSFTQQSMYSRVRDSCLTFVVPDSLLCLFLDMAEPQYASVLTEYRVEVIEVHLHGSTVSLDNVFS